MDTSLHQNSGLISNIKKEAMESAIFEAYLESAPQFIFQIYYILKSGEIGNISLSCCWF